MRTTELLRSIGTAVLLGGLVCSGRAENNTTRIYSSGVTDWTNADFIVGDTGSRNTLIVSNGAQLINVTKGIIGNHPGANYNTAIVTGTGSLWKCDAVYVGWEGVGSQLIIANGGVVEDDFGDVGWLVKGANNTVLITGGGSEWRNLGDFYFGDYAPNNNMTITNGGWLTVTNDSYVGGWRWGGGGESGRNYITVTGSNSLWRTDGALVFGYYKDDNYLTVAAGGQLVSGSATLGALSNAANHRITVTGAGSRWQNNGVLYVGGQGDNSTVILTNGGSLVNSGHAYLAAESLSRGDAVYVTGTASVWTNYGDIHVGFEGAAARLEMANRGKVYSDNGLVGYSVGSTGNVVRITGAGSAWNVSGQFTLGVNGRANQLTVTDGGRLASGGGVIGEDSADNTATISGGASWETGGLVVGSAGGGNTLRATGNSTLTSDSASIGQSIGASNNTVAIDQSVWQSTGNILVGDQGAANQLLISNGGRVENDNATVGETGSRNTVLVSGAGSVWSNRAVLVVGGSSDDNVVRAESGARIFSQSGIIGAASSAARNAVAVSGGSWQMADDLVVGQSGDGNSLAITGGGVVRNWQGIIGQDGAQNTVTVQNGQWLNQSELTVGANGSNNGLTIQSGGLVQSASGLVGSSAGANNNSVLVTGSGAIWTNGGALVVGVGGTGNSLTVSAGGQVINQSSTIGGSASGSGNSALVTGAGSLWLNNAALTVGGDGDANELTLSAGGQVRSASGVIGANGSGNSAVVTGSGSLWFNDGSLTVGAGGNNNELQVLNGSLVAAADLTIGETGLTGNQVTVDGGTLAITNSSTIEVRSGTLNVLSGSVLADTLVANTGSSVVNLNGGTMRIESAQINNGSAFRIGDGTRSAALYLGNAGSTFAGGLVVANGGLLAGTGSGITMTGDYTQEPGGTLELGVTDTTTYERLTVNGTATLGGVLRVVQNSDFEQASGDAIELINATGGRVNEYERANFINDTGLWADLIYGPGTVSLVWTNIEMQPFATTPNQQVIAQTIDDALPDRRLSGLLALIRTTLDSDPARMPALFDAIAPDEYGALYRLPLAKFAAMGDQFRGRINSLRTGSRGFDASRLRVFDWGDGGGTLHPNGEVTGDAAGAADDPFSTNAGNRWGIYIDGAGSFVRISDTPSAAGYNLTAGGFTIGLDRWLNNHFILGANFNYGSDSVNLEAGEIITESLGASFYAVYLNDGWHLEGMLGGNWTDYDTGRLSGGGIATGQTDGTSVTALLGGGYDWQMGRWSLGPEFALQYSTVDVSEFTEKGSVTPLTIETTTEDALSTRFGLHVNYRFTLRSTAMVLPFLSIAWRHEFGDESIPISARFANGAGDRFTVYDGELGADSVALAAGVSVQWGPRLNTYLTYSTDIGRSGYQQHSLNGGFRVSF